jgi:hypothetical protein
VSEMRACRQEEGAAVVLAAVAICCCCYDACMYSKLRHAGLYALLLWLGLRRSCQAAALVPATQNS